MLDILVGLFIGIGVLISGALLMMSISEYFMGKKTARRIIKKGYKGVHPWSSMTVKEREGIRVEISGCHEKLLIATYERDTHALSDFQMGKALERVCVKHPDVYDELIDLLSYIKENVVTSYVRKKEVVENQKHNQKQKAFDLVNKTEKAK